MAAHLFHLWLAIYTVGAACIGASMVLIATYLLEVARDGT